MKAILCLPLLISLIPPAYAASVAGDVANGKRLFDANCTGCHDTRCVLSLPLGARLEAGGEGGIRTQ